MNTLLLSDRWRRMQYRESMLLLHEALLGKAAHWMDCDWSCPIAVPFPPHQHRIRSDGTAGILVRTIEEAEVKGHLAFHRP